MPTGEPTGEPPTGEQSSSEPPAPDADAEAAAREAAMRAEEDAARVRAEAEAASASASAAAAASASAGPPRATLQAPFGSDLTAVSVGGVEYAVDERGYFDVAPEHADAVRVLLGAHWPESEDDE